MSQYRKAVVAAVVGAIASIASVVQAALTDSHIDSAEWQLIATTVIGAVVAVVAVWAVRNEPTPPAPPPL